MEFKANNQFLNLDLLQFVCHLSMCYYVLVVVNMILINMMMAIINMAFEEIKNEKEAFQNKFEIIEYIKRSIKELTGVRYLVSFKGCFI